MSRSLIYKHIFKSEIYSLFTHLFSKYFIWVPISARYCSRPEVYNSKQNRWGHFLHVAYTEVEKTDNLENQVCNIISGFRDGSVLMLIELTRKASLKRSYLCHANIWCKNIPGRGKSKWKILVAEACMVCPGSNKKSSVFGAWKGWRRLTRNESGEVAMGQIM